jgi:hypothetical protein
MDYLLRWLSTSQGHGYMHVSYDTYSTHFLTLQSDSELQFLLFFSAYYVLVLASVE